MKTFLIVAPGKPGEPNLTEEVIADNERSARSQFKKQYGLPIIECMLIGWN